MFVCKCLTQFFAGENWPNFGIFAEFLQSFSILFCVTLEYIPMKGSLKYLSILGILPDTLPIFVLLIAF